MRASLPWPAGRRQMGLTLLETLITLVLIALVSGLIAQALFQIARIELRMQNTQLPTQLEALRRVWVQQSLESLMPGVAGTAERFNGGRRELIGLSSQAPVVEGGGGPQLMRLSLKFDANQGLTHLLLRPAASGTEVVLLSWPGDAGGWAYVDAQGQSHGQWPPEGAGFAPLPELIVLDGGGVQGWLLAVRPLASAQALEKRIDASSLP